MDWFDFLKDFWKKKKYCMYKFVWRILTFTFYSAPKSEEICSNLEESSVYMSCSAYFLFYFSFVLACNNGSQDLQKTCKNSSSYSEKI